MNRGVSNILAITWYQIINVVMLKCNRSKYIQNAGKNEDGVYTEVVVFKN